MRIQKLKNRLRKKIASGSKKFFVFIVLSAFFFYGCGTKKTVTEGNEVSGGDHIPQETQFKLTSMPSPLSRYSSRESRYRSPSLLASQHFLSQINVCIDASSPLLKEAENLENRLKQPNVSWNRSGLQKMLEQFMDSKLLQAFQNSAKHLSNSDNSALRPIEFVLLSSENAASCDLFVSTQLEGLESSALQSFERNKLMYFSEGQLEDPFTSSNSIPALLLHPGLVSSNLFSFFQFGLTKYLGLKSNSNANSFLNLSELDKETLSWHLFEGSLKSLSSEENQTILTFLTFYAQENKNWISFGYNLVNDLLFDASASKDTLMSLYLQEYSHSKPAPFFKNYLGELFWGVRSPRAPVTVCLQRLSEKVALPENYLEVVRSQNGKEANSLSNQVNKSLALAMPYEMELVLREIPAQSDPAYLSSAAEPCTLVVSFRKPDEFPFDSTNLSKSGVSAMSAISGLYAHEGSILLSSGWQVNIPIIYLNVQSSHEQMLNTFAHEFGHFMGFRHFKNEKSIMSPIQKNTGIVAFDAEDIPNLQKYKLLWNLNELK